MCIGERRLGNWWIGRVGCWTCANHSSRLPRKLRVVHAQNRHIQFPSDITAQHHNDIILFFSKKNDLLICFFPPYYNNTYHRNPLHTAQAASALRPHVPRQTHALKMKYGQRQKDFAAIAMMTKRPERISTKKTKYNTLGTPLLEKTCSSMIREKRMSGVERIALMANPLLLHTMLVNCSSPTVLPMRVGLGETVLTGIVAVMVMVVSVVMEGDAVELLKWICHFSHWCSQARVQGYALDPRGSDINTLGLLDIPEVGRLYTLALMWDNWWLHVSQQRPLRCLEEWRSLDVRCTGT